MNAVVTAVDMIIDNILRLNPYRDNLRDRFPFMRKDYNSFNADELKEFHRIELMYRDKLRFKMIRYILSEVLNRLHEPSMTLQFKGLNELTYILDQAHTALCYEWTISLEANNPSVILSFNSSSISASAFNGKQPFFLDEMLSFTYSELRNYLGENAQAFQDDARRIVANSKVNGDKFDVIELFSRIDLFLKHIPTAQLYLKILDCKIKEKSAALPNADITKILKYVLNEELAKMGFYPSCAKAFGYIDPANFLALVNQGIHIKDATADGYVSHGEFGHMIQWLMIAWHQARHQDFLGIPGYLAYQLSGLLSSTFPNRIKQPINLWERCFDQSTNNGVKNFTYPGFTLSYASKEPGLTTLKKALTANKDKRCQLGGKVEMEKSMKERKYHLFSQKYNPPLNENINVRTPIGVDDKTLFKANL